MAKTVQRKPKRLARGQICVNSMDDSKRQAQMSNKERTFRDVTHLTSLAFVDLFNNRNLVLIIAFITFYNYRSWIYPVSLEFEQTYTHSRGSRSPVSGWDRHSLLVPFVLDHREMQQTRDENIKKWRDRHGEFPEIDESGIDRRANLSLEEFWDIYDDKWPVLLTDVVPKWPAYNWTGEFFNETYGQERVTMKAVDLQLDAAISEVFAVLSDIPRDVLHVPSVKGGLSQAVSIAIPLHMFYENTDKANPNAWTYVEDELFIPMRPQLKQDIGRTPYLEEDFFKLFPEEVRPWDAMLLWGTKYSRSSLHMDPYNWTGTNAVIRGNKWWKLFPPGQDQYFYVKPNQMSGFPLNCYKYNSPIDAFDPDLEKYPLFEKASSILFEQLPGELLIIPSGWYHQAYNGDETLAISGQVMNTNNYRVVLEEIIKARNIYREQLPSDIDHMTPEHQVKTVMSLLGEELLLRGKAVTADVLSHIKKGPDLSYGHFLFD